jgi:hypothetical protein
MVKTPFPLHIGTPFDLFDNYPIKKPQPEDFAPGGGPTILCICLQRYEASLNPFTYSVVGLTNHIAFYIVPHLRSQDVFLSNLQVLMNEQH